MKSGLCPKCQSVEVYRHAGSRFANEMITLKDAFITKGISPDKYICVTCGYIEYYLPVEQDLQQDLQVVRDTWEKVTPE